MKKITRLLLAASLLVIGVNSVIAEEIKGLEIKSVFSNDKADGSITILQSGATVPSKARPARVVYVIQGGNLERIYPDGKIVKKQYKAGDAFYLDKPEDTAAYAIKNTGKKDFKAFTVNIK